MSGEKFRLVVCEVSELVETSRNVGIALDSVDSFISMLGLKFKIDNILMYNTHGFHLLSRSRNKK